MLAMQTEQERIFAPLEHTPLMDRIRASTALLVSSVRMQEAPRVTRVKLVSPVCLIVLDSLHAVLARSLQLALIPVHPVPLEPTARQAARPAHSVKRGLSAILTGVGKRNAKQVTFQSLVQTRVQSARLELTARQEVRRAQNVEPGTAVRTVATKRFVMLGLIHPLELLRVQTAHRERTAQAEAAAAHSVKVDTAATVTAVERRCATQGRTHLQDQTPVSTAPAAPSA